MAISHNTRGRHSRQGAPGRTSEKGAPDRAIQARYSGQDFREGRTRQGIPGRTFGQGTPGKVLRAELLGRTSGKGAPDRALRQGTPYGQTAIMLPPRTDRFKADAHGSGTISGIASECHCHEDVLRQKMELPISVVKRSSAAIPIRELPWRFSSGLHTVIDRLPGI